MFEKKNMENIKISIVVSVYNEAEVIELFWDKLKKVISKDTNTLYEVIFVNDGSVDDTKEIIVNFITNAYNIKLINFSRNFGHEAAMIAGIDNATGDAIICLDSDLQHPPELLPELIEKFKEGHNVITMSRIDRKDGGLYKKVTSSLFYYFLNKFSNIKFEHNASDFFLISKKVSNVLKNDFRERARFLRGFIQLIGFKRCTIEYVAPERAGGKSKYSFYKLFLFSLVAIATTSQMPLRISSFIGLIFGAFTFFVMIYSIIMKIFGNPFSGYTTLVVLLSLSFSILFFLIGILGEYIGYVFNEVKARPIYIIDEIVSSKNI